MHFISRTFVEQFTIARNYDFRMNFSIFDFRFFYYFNRYSALQQFNRNSKIFKS